ncbi:MAG: hypothetical protein A2V86_04180 [Deltaproteobacteria bacterium RBG_16_49_23]|nr:MAG: hypothetical protein A2V86_04180 [Deltaproteobacteria bacterium RBG_16_49_23]
MVKDPIVEEVRDIRDSYAKQFNYDLDIIYRDLKELETKSGKMFISLPPKRAMRPERKDSRKKQKMA